MSSQSFIAAKVESLVRRYSVNSVCDYGCGSGELLRNLRKEFPKTFSLTGIDYFSRMCEKHRPTGIEGVGLVDRGSPDFEKLAGRPGFDLIVSAMALHHYQYPVRELRLISGMLHREGILFLADWRPANESPAQAAQTVVSLVDEAWCAATGGFHRHHYTIDEAQDLLGSTEFEVLESSEESVDHADPERKEYAEGKLSLFRSRLDSIADHGLSPAYQKVMRILLTSGVELVEKHGLELTTCLTITARKS
jgi:trans-aconitate methyltransferase